MSSGIDSGLPDAWSGALRANAEAVVDEVYGGVLKREPAAQERRHWADHLRSDGSLRGMLAAAIHGVEFQQLVQPGIASSFDAQADLPHLDKRIAIVSNLQGKPIADAMQVLTTRRAPTYYQVTAEGLDPGRIAAVMRELLAAHESVLTQPVIAQRVLRLAPELGGRIELFPSVTFAAYHPDNCGVFQTTNGRAVMGALGPYHSSIAFFAYRAGMDVRETLKHFSGPVYETLRFHDYWGASSQTLYREGVRANLPLDELLPQWAAQGCFMHTLNHPRLGVSVDIAKALLKRQGERTLPVEALDYLQDTFAAHVTWPVYPEIAERLGIRGSYLFKPSSAGPVDAYGLRLLDLEQFVSASFQAFEQVDPKDLACDRPFSERYREVFGDGRRRHIAMSVAPSDPPALDAPAAYEMVMASTARHPYAKLPAESFWSRSVSRRPSVDVDPVSAPRFVLDRDTLIATGGSCFAEHISRSLVERGCAYLVSESPPEGMTVAEAARRQYGTYSARYGNLYTARQLRQLIERADGTFVPSEEPWRRSDGRWVDPFRPSVEVDGYMSIAQLEADRAEHLVAVRRMFEALEVFVFTLGSTEAWMSSIDGAVFPIAPGVMGGSFDSSRHVFVNFDFHDVVEDLQTFHQRLLQINPGARLLLTVSPVPLAATYSDQHVLAATTYSKSVLRAASQTMCRLREGCDYFPSYEIITGAHNRGAYFGDDLRSIRPSGVDRIMSLFFSHYLPDVPIPSADGELLTEALFLARMLCDEEQLDRFDPGSA
jgi:hypothetical protein